ncbi:MarR family winged helix-turn-helix transcriptional regulator [Galbitalea soli]|uniref:MarR family transcriptional regulator n=1 Tax=Galbitalea soli TaxID=1268042 RepID=A0A7C9TRD4_9MICO|nr:MarR family transcriptional regulator [Galbitalea soli]NEM91958.1 MarR family transcriptional regulator [Galbitalea soli]NYJ32094.1 DNA-binding MarR family transcriptional regulator [Galbitalea soli]
MTTDDEVDLLIDAWARRLPEVNFAPLDVMSRLRRVAFRLGQVRRTAFRSVGLTTWEFDVLAALRRSEPPHELSPAELLKATMTGSATMSNRLELLANRQLIARRENPSDRRSNLARLTPEGIVKVDAAMRALVELEAQELRALTPEQQAQLAALLGELGAASANG